MTDHKKLVRKNHIYLILSVWLLIGFLLVLVTYLTVSFMKTISDSEIAGWLNLVGFSIYMLAGLFIVVLSDFLYIVLFLKWIFFDRKQKTINNKTLYLP